MTAPMRGRVAAMLLIIGAACAADGSVYLASPWPDDHTVVVIVLDDNGAPLASPAIYSPGQVIRPALNRADRFRVHVWTYGPDRLAPNGEPYTSCGLSVGSAGDPLPVPTSAWSTPLVDPGSNAAPVLDPVSLAVLPNLDVRLIGCPAVISACADYRVETIVLDANINPRRIAAMSDDEVMLAVQVESSTRSDNRFIHVRGMTATLLPAHRDLNVATRDLEWDHSDTFYGRSRNNGLFAFDVTGQPKTITDNLVFDGIAAGVDGTVLAFDEQHTIELHDAGTVTNERMDIPFGLEGIRIRRADQILVRTQKTLYAYDGVAWNESLAVAVLDEVRDVIINDDIMALVGLQELVRIRDEVTGAWVQVKRPFDEGRDLTRMAPLSGGRFAVTGDLGSLIVYNGDGWCDLSPGESLEFRGLDAADVGVVVWAIASTTDGSAPVLLRVTAPGI